MVSHVSSDATPTAKQLVFLFMAATVVAVVVFLCGVLVGRAVPSVQKNSVETGMTFGELDFEGKESQVPIQDSVSREPSAAASSGDGFTYYRRLGSGESVPETIRGRDTQLLVNPDRTSQLAVTDLENTSAASALNRDQPDLTSTHPIPDVDDVAVLNQSSLARGDVLSLVSSEGYTVQVTALRRQDTARQVAIRLLAKGFPAYVLQPVSDAPVAVYRVRVGRYADRDEAQQVLQRLEREEQFKPWITR